MPKPPSPTDQPTEWRSITTVRAAEFPATIPVVNASAQVRLRYAGGTIVEAGVQNRVLTIQCYA
ncbi:hypothetical protein GCM10010149_20500 [Nonomuraea roseoviolacea subsp. roseoviolacea]|uniref:Uncharacterized protein n=1 Tax=Nonomuraea roseoviolacea subsp. carminata TaxID=160689 RepID=A0ABT1KEA7_9ACTN|nr:hypothetical protein [Nonomuraea roseoviolacea]MCP2351954.1 hypothetical protein [Nonomuraea roseoviolacea subsp. carminata]